MNAGSFVHGGLMAVHIGAGLIALAAGAVAMAMRKGGTGHGRAGTGFVAAMLVLGLTAAILSPLKAEPESPLGGILVCYFVLTAWMAARRRDGRMGLFEQAACLFALAGGAVTLWAGLAGESTTPAGRGPVLIFGAVCLLAGLLDLNALLRRRLAPAQRLARHVWRMCVAFFIATGSFFLGQQDVMPKAVQGSAWLFVPAFAPFAAMLFWLVRLRFARAIARLKLAAGPVAARLPQPQA
ncbi:MAG TPA: hypothetical protein VF547_05235 [Allosphingosinicella sp.]|jgi:uncharacterized membrane protein